MKTSKRKRYPKKLRDLLTAKSKVLSQAVSFSGMGMAETAKPLWQRAASYEETIAPLLDAIDHAVEAASHRASAATCHEKCGDWSRAANLYQAALAGPLPKRSKREVQDLLSKCLAKLDLGSKRTA